MTRRELVARRMPWHVMTTLHVLSSRRDGLRLVRVSLTLPDHELDAHGYRDSAELFAEGIANERRTPEPYSSSDTGALIVLDISRAGRPHWYGLVITQRADWELDQLWHQLVGHTPTRAHLRKRVRAVTGQAGDWREGRDELQRNVTRCCRYAFKPLPRGSHATLDERVIATGELALAYAWASQPLTERACERCGADLAGKRRDARHCGPTCQKLAHKTARKRAA